MSVLCSYPVKARVRNGAASVGRSEVRVFLTSTYRHPFVLNLTNFPLELLTAASIQRNKSCYLQFSICQGGRSGAKVRLCFMDAIPLAGRPRKNGLTGPKCSFSRQPSYRATDPLTLLILSIASEAVGTERRVLGPNGTCSRGTEPRGRSGGGDTTFTTERRRAPRYQYAWRKGGSRLHYGDRAHGGRIGGDSGLRRLDDRPEDFQG